MDFDEYFKGSTLGPEVSVTLPAGIWYGIGFMLYNEALKEAMDNKEGDKQNQARMEWLLARVFIRAYDGHDDGFSLAEQTLKLLKVEEPPDYLNDSFRALRFAGNRMEETP